MPTLDETLLSRCASLSTAARPRAKSAPPKNRYQIKYFSKFYWAALVILIFILASGVGVKHVLSVSKFAPDKATPLEVNFSTFRSAEYSVALDFKRSQDLHDDECLMNVSYPELECSGFPKFPEIQWSLLEGDREVVSGLAPGGIGGVSFGPIMSRQIAKFKTESFTKYKLRIKSGILAPQLQQLNPRLQVGLSPLAFKNLVFTVSLLEILFIALMVFGALSSLSKFLKHRSSQHLAAPAATK